MEGTASTALVRYVLSVLDRSGVDSHALASRIGLPVWALGDNTARVPLAQVASIWQFVYTELDDPHFGMRMAAQWRRGRLHLNDYLFDAAGTLGEGLAVALRYAGIAADNPAGNDIDVLDEADRATFYYQVRTPSPAANLVASELAVATMLHRAQLVLGRRITPLGLGFAADAPSRHREVAEAFGTHQIDYEQDRTWITFSRADLERPLPGADPGLARMLRAYADGILAVPPSTPGWRDHFREAVSGQLADRTVSLEAVARQLALSPRTLQRRLEQEGTSWRAEIDAIRRAEAARLLGDGASRQAVAARLGYTDTRTLRRSLHRWDLASQVR
ncbi:MAG TPA: AraC family transcriptional regulator ligand-binding domain-containing protein [Streptosporangiaceae bacterium]|nr:AraC family transcriptional regulator ligand-binding domain-containing protein [Streptosporangiaceae bacterium]